MAGLILPEQPADSYQGLPSVFEYVNQDGQLCARNCGQAAAATLLTHHGRLKPEAAGACASMKPLEAEHPPDNLGGFLGTSRRRVRRLCKAHGLDLITIDGEE